MGKGPLSLSDIAALAERANVYAEQRVVTDGGIPGIENLADEHALAVMSFVRDRVATAWAIGYAAALDDASKRKRTV